MDRLCSLCGGVDLSKAHWKQIYCRPCASSRDKQIGARRARAMVANAVRTGRLPPVKECVCVDCGAPATDYDHRDYSKPLQVEPVCRSCNKLRGPAKFAPPEAPNVGAEPREALVYIESKFGITHTTVQAIDFYADSSPSPL